MTRRTQSVCWNGFIYVNMCFSLLADLASGQHVAEGIDSFVGEGPVYLVVPIHVYNLSRVSTGACTH